LVEEGEEKAGGREGVADALGKTLGAATSTERGRNKNMGKGGREGGSGYQQIHTCMLSTWLIICPSCASIPPDFCAPATSKRSWSSETRSSSSALTPGEGGRGGGREGKIKEGVSPQPAYFQIN